MVGCAGPVSVHEHGDTCYEGDMFNACCPVQVTINALENSASIAALVLTTEVLITELPKKEVPLPADPK